MSPETDRREHPRSRRRDIHLTLLDPIGRIVDERPVLVDISQGGARITTRFRGLPGEGVHLRLELPGGKAAMGLGKIRWVAGKDPSAARECGLEFTEFGWGGFGILQSALAPGAAAAVMRTDGSFDQRVDSALLLACLVVGLLVLRAWILRPPMGLAYGVLKISAWEPPRHRPEEDSLRALRVSLGESSSPAKN